MREEILMSKHQEILTYLENLPIGKRVSVRSISNYLGVSDGTAYRAVLLRPGLGVVRFGLSPRKLFWSI